MVLNRKTDWGVIFDLFQRKGVSVDDLLMGPDFFQIVRECYKRQYANMSATAITFHVVNKGVPFRLRACASSISITPRTI